MRQYLKDRMRELGHPRVAQRRKSPGQPPQTAGALASLTGASPTSRAITTATLVVGLAPLPRLILSLTLADLGGVGESIFHTLPDMARNFDTISARPGHERNLMVPYFAAHGRDGVAEGEDCFWIPSGGSRFELSRFGEVVCPERDDGEQSEQNRSGAKDRLVGPLALGFDAEMSAHFLEGDFDLPTTDEPSEDVARMRDESGGKE